MPAKIYRWILQGGLVASLFIVFFVFSDVLFPYITSKQLTFNILTEFLLVIWFTFILIYPEYRPRKNYITFGLLAYFIAILMSCAVSVNFTLSFWGNAERMLGLFHLLHFLIFYLILISVFQTWKQWRILLLFSVIIATLVSIIGLSGSGLINQIFNAIRLSPSVTYSTIGNTAYVSGYIIFNLFFLLVLFFRSTSKKLRWFYAIPAIILLLEFWSCHTSGAIIGLFTSILFLLFVLGLFHKDKIWRRVALITVSSLIVVVIAIFSQSQAAWFQNSFLRNLTSQKATFQTRLISWKSAVADFQYHPIFGTGFGNYAVIFDKHFDPKFLKYSRNETYFDRAHNNLIDITSTTGLVGLFTYLSIFAAVIIYLWRKFKNGGACVGSGTENSARNLEILILFSLLLAYFIQNLAVFDSYVTYIGLMISLGFIVWLTEDVNNKINDETSDEPGENNFEVFKLDKNWEWWTLTILLIFFYLFTSYMNVRPWRMFQGVISGYGYIAQHQIPEGFATYQQAFADNTPLNHDGQNTLVNLVAGNPSILDAFSKEQAQSSLEYVISLARKNLETNPDDSLMQMQLAQVLDMAARFNYQDLAKFNEYSGEALMAMDRSIEASPGRIPNYLVKAQMQLFRGEKEDAFKTVDQAINLYPEYPDGYCRLAQFYVFLKDDQKMGEPLDKCVDLGGVSNIYSSQLLTKFITYYSSKKDFTRALIIAKGLATAYSSDPQILINLAKLYLLSGDIPLADQASQQAIALDKNLSKDWSDFVATVQKAQSSSSSIKTNK